MSRERFEDRNICSILCPSLTPRGPVMGNATSPPLGTQIHLMLYLLPPPGPTTPIRTPPPPRKLMLCTSWVGLEGRWPLSMSLPSYAVIVCQDSACPESWPPPLSPPSSLFSKSGPLPCTRRVVCSQNQHGGGRHLPPSHPPSRFLPHPSITLSPRRFHSVCGFLSPHR